MEFKANNVKWGISDRADGAMNIRVPADEQCLSNRKGYLARQGIKEGCVVSAGLVHGASVAAVGKKDRGSIIGSADGLVTDARGIFLAVTVGDCMPIYAYDEAKDAIGLAHAGWRGIVQGMPTALVHALIRTFGSRPDDISVHIGPHLQKCHFEIKEDVLPQFHEESISRQDGMIRADLQSMAIKQLVSIGIRREKIESSDECTYCDSQRYFSYRRDRPEKVESMLAHIGLI